MALFGLFTPSIGRLEARQDVRALTEALDSSRDMGRRVDAIRALNRVLAERADSGAIEPLIRALDDPNFSVRSEAAEALAHLPSPSGTAALCALIDRAGAPSSVDVDDDAGSITVLHSAVGSLKALRDSSASSTLQRLLSAPQGDRRGPSARATLHTRMVDLIRFDAVLALRAMGTQEAIEASFAYIDNLEDELADPSISEEDADQLRTDIAYLRKSERDALDALALGDVIELSRSDVPSLRRACATALRWKTHDGEPEVEKALLTLLSDGHDRVRKVAEEVTCEVARFSSNREFLATAAISSRAALREVAQNRLANLAQEAETRQKEEAKPEFQKSIERLVLNHDAASAQQAIVLAESHLTELPVELIRPLAWLFQEAFAATHYDGMYPDGEAWRPVKPLAAGLIRQMATIPHHHSALRSAVSAAQKEYSRSWETDTAHEHAERFGWGATIELIQEAMP